MHHNKLTQVIGVTIASLAVIGIIAIIYCICRRKCYNKKIERKTLDVSGNKIFLIKYLYIFLFSWRCGNSLNLQVSPFNLKKSVLLANKYTPNPQYFGCTPPEVPIICRDHLIFLYDIGEGCFGKVYKGKEIKKSLSINN